MPSIRDGGFVKLVVASGELMAFFNSRNGNC
jgi:hypothetical protein